MHILACLLLFVFGSLAAACKGDFSGIEALGKGIGFLVLLFVMLWLFTQPVLLVIVIIILSHHQHSLKKKQNARKENFIYQDRNVKKICLVRSLKLNFVMR